MIQWLEYQQVYMPSAFLDLDAAALANLGIPGEDVYFKTADAVRLHGWFFPAPPGSPRARLVFLIFHGNGGNIGNRLEFYRAWLGLGVNVFVFDYRGYGRSAGTPSEEGTYQDGEAALAWLRQKGFGPGQVVLLGKSLGGGVAAEIATRQPVGGLILQNTFTSLPDLASEMYPWFPVRSMCTIHYNTIDKLPRIRVPVLVLHSRNDELIHFRHAERNYQAANEPKMFREIHGWHNGALEAGRAQYLLGLQEFLASYFPSPITSA